VVEALLGAGADTAIVDTYKGWTAFDHALEALARARTASSDSEDALAERVVRGVLVERVVCPALLRVMCLLSERRAYVS